MSKESVSRSYMDAMKAEHAQKPLLPPHQRHVFITGSMRPHSIGEAIVQTLRGVGMSVGEFIGGDIRDSQPLCFSGDDTLILCHGVTHLDWFEDCPEEKLKEIITVNLTASILMTQDFIQQTLDAPYRKQILFIGSMAYRAVLNGSAAYCASKAGLAQFAKCLAWELAPKGYDVFIIHPSNTEGAPMSEDTILGLMRYRNLSRHEAESYWGASLPKARWLQTGDIADLVLFLTSGKGEYLSGTQIDLPGGQR